MTDRRRAAQRPRNREKPGRSAGSAGSAFSVVDPWRGGAAARRADADHARPEGRAGADQRHAAVDGGAGAGAGRRPSRSPAPPTSPRRCRSTRCAARFTRSRRASTTRGRFAGQRASAANIEALMRGSGINQSHEHCGKVQDAYSLRCAAQVHGAARDGAAVRPRDGRRSKPTAPPTTRWSSPTPATSSSGGNFHGAPIAIAADLLAAAIVPLATISERRTDRLVDPALSGLPAFLTRDGGLKSGLHAGAGHGGRGRVRAQVARASGRRRHDSDLGEQGRPRQHEHDRRAQGGARRRTRARSDRDRNSLRVPGDRPARAARDVAAARQASTRSCDRACRCSTTTARRRPTSSRSRI